MGWGKPGEGTAAYCLYKCTKFKSPFRGSICWPKVPTPPLWVPVPGPSSRGQGSVPARLSAFSRLSALVRCPPNWTWSCLWCSSANRAVSPETPRRERSPLTTGQVHLQLAPRLVNLRNRCLLYLKFKKSWRFRPNLQISKFDAGFCWL